MGRCLAGLLAINLLTVGIAFWTEMVRASTGPQRIAVISQPSPENPKLNVTKAEVKTTAVPPLAKTLPTAKTSVPAPAIAKAPRPVAKPSPPLPSVPPTNPLGDGLPGAKNSDKPLEVTSAPPAADPLAAPKPTIPNELEQTSPPANHLPLKLRLVNPLETGGEVYYAVDSATFSLSPGEYHELSPGEVYQIEFHKGEDFGYAKLQLQDGVYVFAVEASGWSLTPGKLEPNSSLRRAY